MPKNLTQILDALEKVATYTGPWAPLADQTDLLQQRVQELRERESRLDDLLVVALVGGSGVGKSTLLNALAGDELAQTSEFRPCTAVPTIYHPPGARIDFPEDWQRVSGSALEHLVVIDTPDSDTIVTEHRARVTDVLAQCDLILMCADSEKYLDEATWSLLRPLADERTIACVETKASQAPSIKDHWRARLGDQGFSVSEYFRVNSVRSFDRKISGQAPGDGEYDFPALERFLSDELTRERIERIKRSNSAGLLSKTLSSLDEHVCANESQLVDLRMNLDATTAEMGKECFDIVRRRLFAQPHLWTFALGREASLRAKGIVGTLFRLLEYVRTLPARMAGWSLLTAKSGPGHRAASLLANKEIVDDSLQLGTGELRNAYLAKESELGVQYAQAGFDMPESGDGFDRFQAGLNSSIVDVLRGPARERVIARARLLTSWPVAIVSDLPLWAFLGYTGYNVFKNYFSTELLSGVFFVHAGTVLGIILFVELFLLSVATRMFAWGTRRAAIRDLRALLAGRRLGFDAEYTALTEAADLVEAIVVTRNAVRNA